MGDTQDLLAAISNLGVMLQFLVKAEAARAGAPPSSPAPTPAPGQSVAEQIAAYKAKYTPIDPVAFKAKYSVEFKQTLPSLGDSSVDPSRVKEYAQNGYDSLGRYVGGPTIDASEGTPEKVAARMIDEVAHNVPGYSTGAGKKVDPDVLGVVIMTGLVPSFEKWRQFPAGPCPASFADQAFEDFCKTLRGGSASGG